MGVVKETLLLDSQLCSLPPLSKDAVQLGWCFWHESLPEAAVTGQGTGVE